jgi:hypothetical protein
VSRSRHRLRRRQNFARGGSGSFDADTRGDRNLINLETAVDA